VREVKEGKFHFGQAAVIQVIAVKWCIQLLYQLWWSNFGLI
jgi:hypothetical protein